MLKIVQAPDEVLSTQAKRVEKIDTSIKELLSHMRETLLHAKDPEGVGLAAPQVGKSLQIFLVKESAEAPMLTFINPVIEEFFEAPKAITEEAQKEEKETGVQLEGCLSLNNIWGVVKRRYGVIMSYQDEHGKHHKKKFHGFLAVILQHEYDHLQGILFPKRVLEQKNHLYKAVKNDQGETEFEELSL